MRQMTCAQAATCGENLKVRVTPEQSEKVQRAWFAAGKQASHYINQERFLILGGVLYSTNYLATFQSRKEEEIELIDDIEQPKKCECGKILTSTELEYYGHSCEECESKVDYFGDNDQKQPDFASQREVWRYLSASEKENKVINKSGSIIVGFSMCGNLFDYKNHEYFAISGNVVDFSDVLNWQKYTPPRLICVNGVEVPAPLESLEGIDIVYLPNIGNPQEPIEQTTETVIKRGFPLDICYATKEDAIKRAEAMQIFEVVE
jgi:hypothetical protein